MSSQSPSQPQTFLTDAPPRAAGADTQLAVFGKHPSAADHLEDIGLNSASLVAFKQLFYVDAVGKNLAQGRWREPAPGAGLPWAHWILCAGPAGFLLARCVAGEDARGRKQYPLVLAAHVPREEWLDTAPRLEFLASSAAELASAVSRENLESARAAALTRLQAWTLSERPSAAARASFAGENAESPEREKILRVMHALIQGGPRTRARVAPGALPLLEAAVLWSGLLRDTLPKRPVITALLADERPDTLELASSPPDSEAVRGLFPAEGAAAPALTTDVPFRMEPDFTEKANAFIDRWVQGLPPEVPEPVKPGVLGRITRLFRP